MNTPEDKVIRYVREVYERGGEEALNAFVAEIVSLTRQSGKKKERSLPSSVGPNNSKR